MQTEIEVIGRHDEVIGDYKPRVKNAQQSADSLQSKEFPDFTDSGKTPIYPDDKPLHFIDFPKAQKFQELKDVVQNKLEEIKVDPDYQKQLDKLVPIFESIAENVGLCDICTMPSLELWEHEEEGFEGNVCKNCFVNKFQGKIEDFEKFLGSKRKVNDNDFHSAKFPAYHSIKPTATYNNFNPQPKPVKKKK